MVRIGATRNTSTAPVNSVRPIRVMRSLSVCIESAETHALDADQSVVDGVERQRGRQQQDR